jgi:hypothetical protein
MQNVGSSVNDLVSEGHKDLGQYPYMSKLRICWPLHVLVKKYGS